MPLYSAKKILNKSDATLEELNNSIRELEREAGFLRCRSNTDPQLTQALIETEETLTKLETKYNAKLGSQSKNS
jgi:hypothetical protein